MTSNPGQVRILEAARPATSELDRLIFQMETTMGKSHSVSPFTGLYAKYGMSTANNAAPDQASRPVEAAAKKAPEAAP